MLPIFFTPPFVRVNEGHKGKINIWIFSRFFSQMANIQRLRVGSLQKKTHNILDIVSFNRVCLAIGLTFGGADGTRTRDPMRDRHVF